MAANHVLIERFIAKIGQVIARVGGNEVGITNYELRVDRTVTRNSYLVPRNALYPQRLALVIGLSLWYDWAV